MGKNKKSDLVFHDPITNKDIIVDSVEEYQFFNWVIEGYKLGIVKQYEYQPAEFQITQKYTYIPLFNNPKKKEKHLLAEHVYTCDFKIVLFYRYISIYADVFKIDINDVDKDGDVVVYIDVKGGYNRFGGDRILPIHQKLVKEKYNIYINKIVPKDVFHKIGVPDECRHTIKTKKVSHTFDGYNSIRKVFGL